MRCLIVNADDCNLTSGVTRAILNCCAQGIVSSTTWLVNLPFQTQEVEAVKKSRLGVGLHLNVTLGKPVSDSKDISSLVTQTGDFKKRADYDRVLPECADLIREYKNQILLFEKIFGRLPTHLDTHHQLHDQSVFMRALARVAAERNIPVRRSVLMNHSNFKTEYPGLITTQALLGNLNSDAYWTEESLERALRGLTQGTTELMCHPGIVDENLKRITSMTDTREKECQLFSSPHLKKLLEKHNITLIHYGNLGNTGSL